MFTSLGCSLEDCLPLLLRQLLHKGRPSRELHPNSSLHVGPASAASPRSTTSSQRLRVTVLNRALCTLTGDHSQWTPFRGDVTPRPCPFLENVTGIGAGTLSLLL